MSMDLHNSKKVSIILPVYNGAYFLKDSIESVIGQTYLNWELIIVDDGSTDDSSSIMNEYALKDSRIRIIKNEINQKLPKSLNIGFAEAAGTYFTWTSDDNMFRPNALEEMVKFLDSNPDVDLVYTDYTVQMLETGEIIEFKAEGPEKIFIYDVVGACFMYKREVPDKIGGYDPAYCLVEDYEFFIRCALNCNLKPMSQNLYIYRSHKNNLSWKNYSKVREMHEKAVLFHLRSNKARTLVKKEAYLTAKSFIHLYFYQLMMEKPRLRLDLLYCTWMTSKKYFFRSLAKVLFNKCTWICLFYQLGFLKAKS